MKKFAICILLLLLLNDSLPVFAQDIRINEVSSSNSKVIVDNDGEYSDWFELFNNSSSKINLSNYFISDDINDLTKWQFPNVELEPDSCLLVFASGKNRKERVEHWETVFREGDNCKYLVPQSNPANDWNLINYYDVTWKSGFSGIGFGDGDDRTIISQTVTAFMRCKFNIEDVEQISGIMLHVDFDDGFVAYLNGEEIARENLGVFGSKIYFNTLATTEHEAQLYQGNPISSYSINDKISLLQNGENILAIEVHNVSSTSSDLTINPFLSLGYKSIPANTREKVDFLTFQNFYLHTNFKLSSTGELLILSNGNGEIEDSLFTRNQIADFSLGRFPNGSENLFFFNSPTPGAKNIDNGFSSFLEPPILGKEHGFYSTPFFLDISNPNSVGTIRYTLDGSEPTKYSTIYTNQLVVSGISVIRAKIFADSLLPSKTETHTYFINTDINLPIISLTTNPDNFFSSDSGIYVLGPNAETVLPYYGANFWQDWERPIHVEFFEDNYEFGFAVDCGVKISGKWSRANPIKSLAFFLKDEYGFQEIDYKIFPNSDINKFHNFVLRNSGSEWNRSYFRDALMHEIVSPLDIDKQNYRPVVVYLNGQYWGIHNLREKINEHYLESHHNIPKDDINILENNIQLVQGETGNYEQFYYSLQNLNMSTDAAFEYINSKIDVNEFIDYYLAEIFFDNQDWPGNNIKYWQQKSTNSKWRWILFDTDFGFGLWDSQAYNRNTLTFALEKNGDDWPNPPWSTYLLRKFLENETFKNLFISRYSTYTNTIFLPESINSIVTDISTRISSEMPAHFNKWGGNYANWLREISSMKNFANYRSTFLSSHFMNYFGISGQFQLNINQDITKGTVEITDYKIEESSWSGNYFDNIPLKITAVPFPEYVFSHWEGDIASSENPINITASEKLNISPVYIPDSDTQIVINEINYNSSDTFNPDDWIELYNYSTEPIDLSGWIFKDEDPVPVFTIPENTFIDSEGYIILCRDSLLFKSKFPNVKNYYGNFGFGLSGGGELISLYNKTGLLIDSLTYDDKDPWSPICDGGGPTLELKNPNLDNSKYFNWKASSVFGTPGEINSAFTSVKSSSDIYPNDFKLFQNYPNPFNPATIITFKLPFRSYVLLSVYNLLGEQIKVLVSDIHQAGTFQVEFDGSELSSGIYLVRMQADNYKETIKAILIK
ncbi:MAG: CotH kinase family protein [Bacteroidetes bacterium]|nr:CotH kinase family protein [Bacteroidota bacterium]